ncbi:autotransporter outer membrane beta-barrel domain-containing protein, partial [Parasutterella secunda]
GVNEVAISQSNTVTLVGGDDKELIAFAGEGDKSVTVEGTLKLGDAASTNNSGKLSAPVTITNSGEMNVQAGSYQIADLTVNSSSLVVNNASASIDTLKLNTSSTITSGSQAVEVKGMTVDATAHTVTGAVNVEKLTAAAGSVINVGTKDARGDMTVGETSELNGMTFFLDPAWVEGQEVTDASRLVFKNPKVDAKVIAGHNSYVVFGSGNTTNFTPVFGKQVTWGQGGVLAAAYVAQPITIDANGALVVDGSLQQLGDAPAAGSVTFGENSVLVADVTELASGEALITADTFNVNDASKAVIVGSMKNGETYKLASVDNVWSADQIVSGNALWSLTGNDDGSFTVKLEDATKIFGDLMQGGQLANAGMTAGGDAGNYVDSLLTDASGNVGNLASTAARFDAAMNIGGALSVFTNAYDRAGEFREIVRSESTMDQEPRLWAHVMGGKTKLKGISSGAQSVHTETDHYGIVIGAEGMVTNNLSLGVALAAGTGDTDNDKVNAKDEFDYYGISAYGRTTVGFVDILGDVSATFLKSDMKMHGVADIDADADTAVYSAGVQAQKTLNLGWADVTPFIGMDVYHVRSDGYSAGHGIKVEDSDATAVEFPIGAKLAKS